MMYIRERLSVVLKQPMDFQSIVVELQDFGWYRIDPRGNKENVNAQFVPPREQLAFKTMGELEKDFPEIWAEPLPVVVEDLQNNLTYHEVYLNLPDYSDMIIQ